MQGPDGSKIWEPGSGVNLAAACQSAAPCSTIRSWTPPRPYPVVVDVASDLAQPPLPARWIVNEAVSYWYVNAEATSVHGLLHRIVAQPEEHGHHLVRFERPLGLAALMAATVCDDTSGPHCTRVRSLLKR